MGGLQWRPQDFWQATLTEFFEAIHGYNDAKGGGGDVKPPTDQEMAALIAKYG